jgi:hypothetical protein
MRVFVLLFNARTDNEGIHTLQVGDQNVVLMFEDEDDATRFGLLLEAQDFPTPTVEAFDPEEIQEFCEAAGHEAKLIPPGTLMMPPEQTVEKLDWAPDAPPDSRPQSRESAQEMSTAELDRIRRQLENLL